MLALTLKTMETQLIFIFITLMFAWYNGVFNLWGLEKDTHKKARYSQFWHTQGFMIRAAMALLATLLWGLLWGYIAVILLWHCFDILINLTRGQGIFYSGTVSTFDKYSKLTWIAKIVFLLTGIFFLL